MSALHFGPDNPSETYVSHAFPEQTIDTGEVEINYAVAGTPDKPAVMLIPGQTESWWGYEQAMQLLRNISRPSPSICAGREGQAGLPAATHSTISVTTWCDSLR